jgi:magnesium-transporting ATPase (P-type)
VLAVAYRTVDAQPKKITPDDVERDPVSWAFGMIDPPRPEVPPQVDGAQGRHSHHQGSRATTPITAAAIGRAIGLPRLTAGAGGRL